MYIIYEAYDDNTAVILDIPTFQRMQMTEKELINFGNKNDVLGLSISGQKINYINAYNCITFGTENEADEYIRDTRLSYKNKRYAAGYWIVLEKKEYKIHVDYYICTYKGDEVTYLGKGGGYTPYIQAAQSFDKRTAGEKAALMTKKSKTGTHWTTQRVPIH